MSEQREEWITKRAYELWEQAGGPDGKDLHHWAQAAAEWDERTSPHNPAESSPAVWDEEDH